MIIGSLPVSDRILIEAGTPLIKQFGQFGIQQIRAWWQKRIRESGQSFLPYVVADLKCMDRGEREVKIASGGGASAAVALGQAPTETLNAFIENQIIDTIHQRNIAIKIRTVPSIFPICHLKRIIASKSIKYILNIKIL